MDTVMSYWNIILEERNWSWKLIAAVFLIAAMMIRSWFTGSLARKAKALGAKHYRQIQRSYLKRSIPGWILFLGSLGLTIALWLKGNDIRWELKEKLMFEGVILCFIFSILFHLSAFSHACLDAFRKHAEGQPR